MLLCLIVCDTFCLFWYCLQVVKFIKKRGRVTLAELAAESNKLIKLNP